MAPLLAGLYADPLNGTGSADARPNTVPGSWLSGIFPAAGYDAWLAVDIEDEEDWLILCAVMDRHDLRAGHRSVALENGDAMRQQLGRWAAGQTAYTAMHTLQKAGLAAAVVQTSEDIWRDPQLNVRGFPEQVEQPDLGTVTYPRSAQRWTKTPGALPVRPARLGEHSAQVLQEWLGTTAPQLQGLIQTGAIFDAG
jgi:crotonobetainyl-CoA:carnitine CoA-transferase CaiB-like acyl-CoA transferase